MKEKIPNRALYLVNLFVFLAVVSIFFGRSMQLIIYEAPLRALLWDSSLMKPIVAMFSNQSWNEYVTNIELDQKMQLYTRISGFILLLSTASSIAFYITKKKAYTYLIYLGSFFVSSLIFLEFKEKFYQLPQFLEGGIQVLTPLTFTIFYTSNKTKQYIFLLKIAIIITFLGHGFYALNLLPTPGHFIDMFIVILGVSEQWARYFLIYFGILDLLVLVFIFVRKADKHILTYATNWGFITAFARIVFYLKVGHFEPSAWAMFYLTVYRLGHGFVPLALLCYVKNKKSNKIQYKYQLSF